MPFDLFSARMSPKPKSALYTYDSVPRHPFRVQVWYTIERAFGKHYYKASDWSSASLSYNLWVLVRDTMRQELGVFALSKDAEDYNPKEECFHFFMEADTAGALDFIDLAFRVADRIVRIKDDYVLREGGVELLADDAIEELNTRFDQSHLGYQFTGGELMRRDSQLIHRDVTEETVRLLAAPGFEGPNEEFLRAHKAYLSGNFKEALREALNAFESTLKAILTQRRWSFDPQKDASSKLLSIVFEKGLIPSYLQSEFAALRTTLEAGIPTIRNKAAGHGQGPDPVEIPSHLAAYGLHLTGAGILFLAAAHEKLK